MHLLHEKLFAAVASQGINVSPGDMGENLTTRGIDLLASSPGTRLRIGLNAVVEITGLRNPCSQIEKFQAGLLAAVLVRGATGSVIRKAGVVGIVLEGGFVQAKDAIKVIYAPCEYKALLPA